MKLKKFKFKKLKPKRLKKLKIKTGLEPASVRGRKKAPEPKSC